MTTTNPKKNIQMNIKTNKILCSQTFKNIEAKLQIKKFQYMTTIRDEETFKPSAIITIYFLFSEYPEEFEMNGKYR